VGRLSASNAGDAVGDYRAILRRLALRDDRYIDTLLAEEASAAAASELDPRGYAMARIGALIAADAAPPSYMSAVEDALATGATYEEIVGTLIAVMPVVGVARVVSAAPNLGLALGYDVGAALEGVENDLPLH
jgi:4-carboxymuconolactone decarboxylase